MGKLVIDGNSVFEIDEECVKKNHPPIESGIYEFLRDYPIVEDEKKKKDSLRKH